MGKIIKKITTGAVTQIFDVKTGKCTEQYFTADDVIVYENENGKQLVDHSSDKSYHPFNMEKIVNTPILKKRRKNGSKRYS